MKSKQVNLFLTTTLFLILGVSSMNGQINSNKTENTSLQTATFGAGCFWCVEAVFQSLNGVEKVTSGYSGGKVKKPSYKQVTTGTTGHAEVCQITYNPKTIGYDELLEVFWSTHDPTTLNKQGADVGTQYRSVIFYHNEKQRKAAEKYKTELNKQKVFEKSIVTEIKKFSEFFVAEDYHQNYFNENGNQPYCSFVILPKLEKFKKVFKEKLKK
ncbi:MAG: peptide-methionine (S)-S-oxide reductase MsrA [Bacteroidetes bacterium]|nr:peptide-methionine (S)-S-oxide reductase MsrA [Bacteroidota bacterium]